MLLIAVLTGFLTVSYAGDGAYCIDDHVNYSCINCCDRWINASPRLAKPFAIIYASAEGVLLELSLTSLKFIYPGVAVTALIGTGSIFYGHVILIFK
jgi:hypothetical protein